MQARNPDPQLQLGYNRFRGITQRTYKVGYRYMCQSNAYLERDGEEKLILEDVGLIKPEDGKVRLISIFGEEEVVDAEIKVIDLLHHKIILGEQ